MQNADMLTSTRALFESLNSSGIRYCHWKSNWALARTISGETDIDLLIDRGDAVRFRQILAEHGFRPAVDPDTHPLPAVEHHYAFDADAGILVHVHAYSRIITGESLSKNYRLPLEEMLLQNLRREGIVNVPTRGAELIVFTIRMLVKHTTLIELAFLARDWKNTRAEVDWLITDGARTEATALLPAWLPNFDPQLFEAAVTAMQEPGPLRQRLMLGRRVRSELRSFARHRGIRASVSGARRFSQMARSRLLGSKKGLAPGGGGAVIAFVGSEATGKSTLLGEMDGWLGEHFTVKRLHAGKPPSTALTFLPNLLVPALRNWFPGQRSVRVEVEYARDDAVAATDSSFPLLFAVRSVLLAHDRRALLRRAFARAANGTVVLCDRYPSSRSGGPDSAQLGHLPQPSGPFSVRRWLTGREARLYGSIPPPDLVFFLTAPLDVTLERNAARAKTESPDFVRHRHARSAAIEFDNVEVHRIETDQPFGDTLREVRSIIWGAL